MDFCNAVSAAYAIPLAVFDADAVAGDITVTFARGDADFVTNAGLVEHPDTREVIFRDTTRRAQARRWAHRQGAAAAVSASTRRALRVAEAMHDGAEADLAAMRQALADGFAAAGAMPVIQA